MTANVQKITLSDLTDTRVFANNIARTLKIGDILAITGEMGVGKTALCAAIINNFFPDIIATSPTFNLVNIYDNSSYVIHHYDLYRLNTTAEVINIGIEESFAKAITLIEWPSIIKSILPKDIITIEIVSVNNSRYISLQDNRT
jgi:tRNA threonylcarbamoyl adenosine modification protein YjeE